MASLLTGVAREDIEDMPLEKAKELLTNAIAFYTSPRPEPKEWDGRLKIELNGHKYNVLGNLNKGTTRQFLLFERGMIAEPDNIVLHFTKLLIPAGHKWDDGYNMEDVERDIESMRYLDAQSLCFFFTRTFQRLSDVFLRSSLKTLTKELKKTTNITERQRAEYLSQIESLRGGLN